MRTLRTHLAVFVFLALAQLAAGEDWLDHAADLLTISAFNNQVRVRLSGLWDLEGYSLDQPPPGLIYTDNRQFLNYRFTFFLDAQIGEHVYAFAQTRIDRGFDPSEKNGQVRLDEYALRYTPWKDGRFSIQIGKFGTVAGTWMPRHDSWDNPFVTAPLPYENLTGVWDSYAADELDELRAWAHILPAQRGEPSTAVYSDKILRVPIIWGPSYASGASIFGALGKFEYAAEIKNSSLSSRPEAWDLTETGFDNPTFTTRFAFHPNPMWTFGVTGSTGTYLLSDATIEAPGRDLSDYRQWLLGQDITFEWHHFQLWAEFFENRFEIPGVGHADTFAYYLEAKYKFTPQLFGALRWNQQLYGTIRDAETGLDEDWGRDLWRIDAALGYRFTAHTQLKLQYSIQHEEYDLREYSQMLAGQFTVKF